MMSPPQWRPHRPPGAIRCLIGAFLLALGLLPASVLAAISASERQALLDLYASTNGDGWLNSAGWGGAPGTECAWFGVTCAADGNSVKELVLTDNRLSGTLPANLQDLANLTLLFLGNNGLSGSIPPLANITGLEDFGAGTNQLSGPIPALNSLSSLDLFDVGNNDLTGTIPDISALTSLRRFDVSDNDLTGSLPPLATNTGLTSFLAGNNRLSGPVPSLANLNALQAFFIENNRLSGPPPAVADPSALLAGQSRLCPNFLFNISAPEWDAATGSTPWHELCVDDVIFRHGFDPD